MSLGCSTHKTDQQNKYESYSILENYRNAAKLTPGNCAGRAEPRTRFALSSFTTPATKCYLQKEKKGSLNADRTAAVSATPGSPLGSAEGG